MKVTLTNRRKWLLGAGAALLLTATPSFALFGIGDIVFDPTSYASLVSQLTTLQTQYNMLKNNITHFSAKQQWQTTLHALENVNVANMFGETAGMSIALNTNSPGASSTAWKAATVTMNGSAPNYLASQSLGSSRTSQLAMIETADSVSPDCLTAVGQYRAARSENATANTTLLSQQFDGGDSTNSEVQQLNLLNAAEAQKLSEMQSQGTLHACLASQMTVANMERRNAQAEDLNTAVCAAKTRMIALARGSAMSQIAASFLRRCFAPDETIAILLRSPNAAVPKQRVVRLESVLEMRYMAWLSYENQHGLSNIYVAANPLRPGSRKRTKECIASVRHLYLDIDEDGDARLATLRASRLVPPPTSILSTSPGKYQVLWRVEGFEFPQQEQMLKMLAIAFGGDPACTDCNRVLRVPGFLNRKYDLPCKVTVEYPDDSIWTPDDFQLDAGVVDAMLLAGSSGSRKPPSKHSNSESDWAWVSDQLAHGKDAGKLTRELASRRSDKPNPLYYAQRTVDVASARLWFIEGIPFDDVVTMLETRRRFELPAALCSARAREIAATAQRMIAHRKSA